MPSKTSTYLLNSDNDLYLDDDYQIATTTSITKIVAIRIKARFLTFLGEWYQDTTIGIPWLSQVLIKGADLTTLKHLFTAQLQKISGVKTVNSLTLSLNQQTRELTMTFSVEATDGTTMETSTGSVTGTI